jgi:hypothetical protein
MGKNRLGLHWVTIAVIALFAFLAISSGASTPKTLASVGEDTIISSVTTTEAVVRDMPVPAQMPGPPPPAGKQFDVLDLVFASSVSEIDENGLVISSQEGIVTMLLREAQKLGGNDILNLRIDKNETTIQTQTVTEGSSGTTKKTVTTKKITYTGSALAIKYRN